MLDWLLPILFSAAARQSTHKGLSAGRGASGRAEAMIRFKAETATGARMTKSRKVDSVSRISKMRGIYTFQSTTLSDLLAPNSHSSVYSSRGLSRRAPAASRPRQSHAEAAPSFSSARVKSCTLVQTQKSGHICRECKRETAGKEQAFGGREPRRCTLDARRRTLLEAEERETGINSMKGHVDIAQLRA